MIFFFSARMAPTNVKARHAHVVAQIVNAHAVASTSTVEGSLQQAHSRHLKAATFQGTCQAQVEECLNKTISLHYRNVSIRDVYEDLSKMTGLNIHFDKEALEAINRSNEFCVNCDKVSAKTVLNLLTESSKLAWIIDHGNVTVVKPGLFRQCAGVAFGFALDCPSAPQAALPG